MEALLGSQVIKNGNQKVEVSSLSGDGKVVGLYFSAHWCPPCRAFTPVLAEYYNAMKAGPAGDKFEIVFVSFDRDEKNFEQYFGTMPWLALDFESDKKKELGSRFEVKGIPALVFLNAANGAIKTKDGRSVVSKNQDIQTVIDM